MNIIGISAFFHDSSAALIIDGEIICAAEEERFTRFKHDSSFPINSIYFCLNFKDLKWENIDAIVFFEKPWLKFERILESMRKNIPTSIFLMQKYLPSWISEKLFIENVIYKYIPRFVPVKYSSHHLSHSASAYFTSEFNSSAIVTIDGVGEWSSATISLGEKNKISTIKSLNYPNSVGLLYSSFTYFLGFKVNSGEYKMMGLAPYGDLNSINYKKFYELINKNLFHLYNDGSLILNLDYFSFDYSDNIINLQKWESLFGIKYRKPENNIIQQHCDLALAIQKTLENVVLKIVNYAQEITKSDNLCLAGGIALNCVCNTQILLKSNFKNIWIQPASGDAGGAIGAALIYYYTVTGNEKLCHEDQMKNSYLGPKYNIESIENYLNDEKIIYKNLNSDYLIENISKELANGKIIGLFQGRMEFGPRSLGNRSILADPRPYATQQKLNLLTKKRENFRPFAPVICEDSITKFFTHNYKSPYMLYVNFLKDDFKVISTNNIEKLSIIEKLETKRSLLQAVTHIDYSARVQTVTLKSNPLLFNLLKYFEKITNYPILVNTSFNIRGEPIVCTPQDALNCFFNTEIDILIFDNLLIYKVDQDINIIKNFIHKKINFSPD